LIRQKIVECFRGTDEQPDLESVVSGLGLNKKELAILLQAEPPLESLAGLTIEKALHVLRQFEGLAMFNAEIEKSILDFNESREQIRAFEKRAADKDV
jgi:hypothetical protein